MRSTRGFSPRQRRLALGAATLAFALTPASGHSDSAAREALRPGGVELSTGLSLSHQAVPNQSHLVLNVPARVGAMLDNRFELEGELLLTWTRWAFARAGSSSESSLSAAAHALYHVTTRGNAVPFLLVGVGYGNATSVETVASTGGLWLLQAGAGVECFAGRHAALRAEYRFTRKSGNAAGECNIPEGCTGLPDRTAIHENAVLLGVSLWF